MEAPKRIKLVIDTNWWISLLLSKVSTGLPALLLDQRFIICFSAELEAEIYSTLQYFRNQKRINAINLTRLKQFFSRIPAYYEVVTGVTACRDPKDNFLLALAQTAQADFLLTNDQDLLVIGQFASTRILSPATFRQLFQLQ
ncbi:MAG: putative toxin-antitoxin system toxin component, PIN family [Candidatus Pseudobacter hemicellulosilyticus]|uniref:Toxin-antitoxin system toxin component, PIN family n=1 Tax=Candidatus Pseudobacter hemicellulosilyticus TaxID=3121375 RepID=A0AAJ5WKU1_9BACT|nr:MAG: putative toxin-antitoxin system toxin component, PIN family [Pseudobacter sp.]